MCSSALMPKATISIRSGTSISFFYAKELHQGEAAVGFINDFRFGTAKLETVSEEQHRILVTIHSQITQEVILCLSGYMACLARLFDLDYDGWGCIAQRPT